MSVVKFLDLKAQYLSIKDEVDAAVLEVLDSTAYVQGPKVLAFEKAFAKVHGADHGVAVNTGTSALHVALLAEGIGVGDEVITVPMTFTATVAAISYTGATPVFVDVDPETYTMDPSQIAAKITQRTRAIVPVHLYGQAADMDPIMEIARLNGLKVIEDCAQAHLATYKGCPVGSIGDYGCFSFYPGKNLGAYGEGGLVTTNDAESADRMRLLRDWGQVRKYHHEMLAYNYRMDGIQGAVLGVKLKYLEGWTESRRSRAALYRKLLVGSGFKVTTETEDRRHVYHIFSVFHPERDRLQAHLIQAGIESGMHYPFPVHLQKAYAYLGHTPGDFPVSEAVANTQLSVPIYPEMPDSDVALVVDAIKIFS
jgi:dTDP-4-amino-4,6-dideoxygalactose transaminase